MKGGGHKILNNTSGEGLPFLLYYKGWAPLVFPAPSKNGCSLRLLPQSNVGKCGTAIFFHDTAIK
jgi:hypothetical protein